MMFKIFVAIFAVAFCLAQLSDQMTIYSDRDGDEDNDWEKFKNETKKDYKKNKTEEASRKALFSRRRKDIIANNNNKSKPFKMAINLFSDRTDAEIAKLCGKNKTRDGKTTTTMATTLKPAGRQGQEDRQAARTTIKTTKATTTKKPVTTKPTTTKQPVTTKPTTTKPTTTKSTTTKTTTTKVASTTTAKATATAAATTTAKPGTGVDYRKDVCMPAVKNQGQCGSCWAFAAIVVVEFNYCVKFGNKAVLLSEEQLVDCSTVNYGCNGGWQDEALKYIASNGKGSFTEASYPYIAAGGTAGQCKTTGITGATISTTKPVTYLPAGNVAAIKAVLDSRNLVTVDIAVVSSFMSYASGVYVEPNCNTNILGYHAITVVGYGTDAATNTNYWIIRNSWSAGWGLGGYIFFKSGVNQCGVESYPVATTI